MFHLEKSLSLPESLTEVIRRLFRFSLNNWYADDFVNNKCKIIKRLAKLLRFFEMAFVFISTLLP